MLAAARTGRASAGHRRDARATGAAPCAAGAAPRAQAWLPYQRRWIEDESTVKVWQKSRRIGADFTEAFCCVRDRFAGRRTCDAWYSSADESAAVEWMEYVRTFARDVYGCALEMIEDAEAFDGRDIRVMSVRLPEINGRRSRITAMASNPKSFRSKGGDVILSELAHHENAIELWRAAFPATTWGYRLRVMSTHNGEEAWFNQLVRMGLRHADPQTHGEPRPHDVRSSVHTTTIHDAVADGLVERINEVQGTALTRERFVEDLRRGCGDEIAWNQEYLCKPSADNGSYFPYDLIRPCVREDLRVRESLHEFVGDVERGGRGGERGENRGGERGALFVGCDVGRVSDRFALWAVEDRGGARRTTGALAWRGRTFGEMEVAIAALMGMGRLRRLCIDSTGIGMQLAERMRQRFGSRVEPVTFTLRVKEDLATGGRAALEERTCTLPDDAAALAEINSIRRLVTAAGNVRYDAERNERGHADLAWAWLLAVHAAGRRSAPMAWARCPVT
ncbi:MAG: hypothetical protein BroJett004_07980 [Planctomycetota bacterium]|nr:MAG: hypothetical protein BroJett004_07980 [Planctomycetota bacterium]